MSEATVAENYRILIGQAPKPVDAIIDSATQKAAELSFLKILSELETSLVETILRSENLTTALTKIAHINQLNALADEAFRQASILGDDIAKKAYHQQIGFQICDTAKQAEVGFINQFANSQGDFKTAVNKVFNVSSDIGGKLLGNSIGAIVSWTKPLSRRIRAGSVV